jgi:hypothetical protein
MSAAPYLNAVVDRGRSFRVITEEYSRDAVKELLGSHAPEAITLAPAGALDASVLLAMYRDAFERSYAGRQLHHWKWYLRKRSDTTLRFCGELDNDRKLLQTCEELSHDLESIALFISARNMRAEEILLAALRSVESKVSHQTANALSRDQQSETLGASDRERLRDARQALLDQVPSFTSEELASGGGSISDNPSQYALDLRSRGKVFGVRFGRTWHYPKFQFDAQRRAVPEMKEVLEALTPDPQGWDRLQWFVTPHEKLHGETPLKMWKTDRQKVMDAAKAEQWHGRRD